MLSRGFTDRRQLSVDRSYRWQPPGTKGAKTIKLEDAKPGDYVAVVGRVGARGDLEGGTGQGFEALGLGAQGITQGKTRHDLVVAGQPERTVILAAAGEFGDQAIQQMRDLIAFYEACRVRESDHAGHQCFVLIAHGQDLRAVAGHEHDLRVAVADPDAGGGAGRGLAGLDGAAGVGDV
mgnify:CR=1 FL=1